MSRLKQRINQFIERLIGPNPSLPYLYYRHGSDDYAALVQACLTTENGDWEGYGLARESMSDEALKYWVDVYCGELRLVYERT